MLRKEQPLGGNLASAVVEFAAGCVTPSNACLCFGQQKENQQFVCGTVLLNGMGMN